MEKENRCWPCDEVIRDRLPPCPLHCASEKCKAYQKPAHVDTTTQLVIWVLGGPGSGKGTQCDMIVRKYGFTHLSTGDLLRAETKKDTERAVCIADILRRGELVPNDVVLSLLKEAIIDKINSSKGFLIDGYPREEAQGHMFEINVAPVSTILYFEASAETLKNRILERAVTSGRTDDNEESIKYRLRTFYEHNDKILDLYPHKVTRINAERKPDAIFQDVVKEIDRVLAVRAEQAKELAQRQW